MYEVDMKEVLIIGGGISGMTCALSCARQGIHVKLISPQPSEWSQSVMAAGGINAVTADHEEGDSIESHIEDTLKGGSFLGGKNSVYGLCSHAEKIIRYLERIGAVFTINDNGRPVFRAFGGQTHKRTYFCGSSTGKQIVSALIMEIRRFEAAGLISRSLIHYFHSALIMDGTCYGALLFNKHTRTLEPVFSDAVVMAVGGQNALFRKTTGSTQCDGYAVGRLFLQGAVLKNLEFIQYHPTTIETVQKRMLISEAVRGEGGRLFYLENGKRIYFMENKYGPNGNLMTRDVISREIDSLNRDVFLDISFKDQKLIEARLEEVRDLCAKFRGIDITKEPIPVAPSVHFFMGGLAVHLNHETNIRNLYGVGECASMYHGANRLGGNSLLSALYSAGVAGEDIAERSFEGKRPDFTRTVELEQENLRTMQESKSPFASMHIRDLLGEIMSKSMGIVRTEDCLNQGIRDVDFYLSVAERIQYDASVSDYSNYSLQGMLTLARAVLTCARARKESRGAHYRSDYPKASKDFDFATLITYENGTYRVELDKEKFYEN